MSNNKNSSNAKPLTPVNEAVMIALEKAEARLEQMQAKLHSKIESVSNSVSIILYYHYRSYSNIIIIMQVELANTVMMSMKRKMDDLQDDNSNDNEPESTTKKIKLVMETLSDYLNKVNIFFLHLN
jgi:hypothetical protein